MSENNGVSIGTILLLGICTAIVGVATKDVWVPFVYEYVHVPILNMIGTGPIDFLGGVVDYFMDALKEYPLILAGLTGLVSGVSATIVKWTSGKAKDKMEDSFNSVLDKKVNQIEKTTNEVSLLQSQLNEKDAEIALLRNIDSTREELLAKHTAKLDSMQEQIDDIMNEKNILERALATKNVIVEEHVH